MDEYDYQQIDKQMSEQINAIYSNPARHRFLSCFDAVSIYDITGPRGGKVIGRKLICYHCGQKKKGHAEQDEQL